MPPERRRVLWQEPLPAVELADRLRRVPLFDFVSVDELFRVASLGRQVRHETGRIIAQEGQPSDALHFVLDGRVSSVSSMGEAATLEPPAVVGFEEALEGHPQRATVKALEPTITLTMTTDEFLTLVSENVEIAQGIFRMLLETRWPSWRAVVHGELSPDLARRVADGVQAVDRLLLLQASPLLQRATTTELVRLAGIARIVTLGPGDILFKAGDAAAIHAVVAGAVEVEGERTKDTAHAGDVVGMYEALGGRDMTSQGRVSEAGTALLIDRAPLFELLADHMPLLQGIFSGLLHAARRATGRTASSRLAAAAATPHAHEHASPTRR
jgi:CRP-like cAMP-binding protein